MVRQKVAEVGVNKEKGYMYFLNKEGNVSRVKMSRGKSFAGKNTPEVVAETGVDREKGWLYYIDQDGDVSRAEPKYKKKD